MNAINHLFSTKVSLAILCLISTVGILFPAHAADTVETFDIGATDVDFYLGVDNVGLEKDQGLVFADMMLGYGLVERLSAYIGSTFQVDRNLDQGSPQHYLGLFGTPVDGDHIDLDLFLDFTSSSSGATITPSFEMNWDQDPTMATYGFYIRAGVIFEGQSLDTAEEDTSEKISTTFEVNPGVYWSLAPGRQILIEFSTGYLPSPAAEEDKWDSMHMHLGWNQTLGDVLELVTEVNFTLEKIEDKNPWGSFIGLIATLP